MNPAQGRYLGALRPSCPEQGCGKTVRDSTGSNVCALRPGWGPVLNAPDIKEPLQPRAGE